MTKIVTVASQYTIYEVPDEAFEVLSGGELAAPPQIVLETLVLNGQAVRIGKVSTLTMDASELPEYLEEREDEDPPEGAGPWADDE